MIAPKRVSAVGKFIDKLVNAPIALTFEDVVLLPSRSSVEPREVDLSTNITVNIKAHIPIVSSPMDTVTEAEMAIALARLGGLGIVHRNCSRENQVELVKKVKEAPVLPIKYVYLEATSTVEEAYRKLIELNTEVLPVVDSNGLFLGYFKYSCIRKAESKDPVAKYVVKDDVLRKEEILRADKIHLKSFLAIVDSNGRYWGTLDNGLNGEITPLVDEKGRLMVGAAISPYDLKRAKMLEKWVDVLVVDVAHFHNLNCIKATKKLLREVSVDIVVGNIGTYEACEDILTMLENIAGLRVGIASGSICSTGIVTGVAAPTLFAVANVRDALEDYGVAHIPIIADGGIKTPGDAAKALAAGASAVMLGRALAGTDEACSPLIPVGSRLYKLYRGMGSKSALAKRYSMDRYSLPSKKIAEGVEGLVPYRGSVASVVEEFKGGLQAALGYVGARNIKELWLKAKFAKLTPIGRREVLPHDILTSL